jgi:uncharacterized protein GlcG (DUF336 family)
MRADIWWCSNAWTAGGFTPSIRPPPKRSARPQTRNKRPTSARGAQAQPLDVAHAIGLALAAGAERWTAMEGGFPVIVEGECIGGIGGDWETDARIAREAVEAIGAAWSA